MGAILHCLVAVVANVVFVIVVVVFCCWQHNRGVSFFGYVGAQCAQREKSQMHADSTGGFKFNAN